MTTALNMPIDPLLGDWRQRLSPACVLEACRAQLQRVPADERRRWQHAEMIEALYHPDRYVRVAYVLLDDPDTPPERRWPQGQIVYLNAPVREPVSRRGQVIELDRQPAEAYTFPNDRRLRGLRKFTAKAAAVEAWQGWIDASTNDFVIDGASLQRLLVRYVPEQKWIVRLRAEGIERASGERTKRRIAIRSASPAATRRLAERHAQLSEVADASNGLFRVPAVLGGRPAAGLLALEWIRGDSLVETLRREPPEPVLRRVAAILAAVHRARPAGLTPLTTRRLIERMQHAAGDLAAVSPPLAARLRRLAREFAALARSLPRVEPAALHNDFHWNQLRIKRDRCVLLDLERMCLGDPLIDVATFVTQIRMLAVRPERLIDATTAEHWTETFLTLWPQASQQPLDDARMRAYAALSRLELARGMMRHLRPGWDMLAHRCVELAETDLGALTPEVSTR